MKHILDFMGMEKTRMRIAVLSGKGGTGKTMVSVNLAAAAEASYVDCDVEEPNGHLFFKPEDILEEDVFVSIPQVDSTLCDGCRKCTEFCRYNALAYVKDRLIVFDDVCHSCGGCVMVCPHQALTEKNKVIGKIRRGISDHVSVHSGMLNVGEASGVPIIKRLLEKSDSQTDGLRIIDCPPGSSCMVMESIREADYCILVAEPTVFGVHNLNMVYDRVKLFHKPFGVVLNKCLDEENPAEKFCKDHDIKVLGRIPFDKELGLLNSNAEIAVRKDEKYHHVFSELLETVKGEVQHETASRS